MPDDILNDLNPEQREAVTHMSSAPASAHPTPRLRGATAGNALLIVAGAGTGKTTVITRRLAWLILEQKIKPDEILALTFTNKAAEEMSERVDKLLPYGYVDLWVSTFHGFAERVLKNHAIDIGLSPDVELLDETGQWLLVRRNLEKFELDYYRPGGNPTKFIQTLLDHFSRLKDEEISPEDYLQYAESQHASLDDMESSSGKAKSRTTPHPSLTRRGFIESPPARPVPRSPSEGGGGVGGVGEGHDNISSDEINRILEVANAYHTYQQLLRDGNKMDFGDLINYCLKLFRTRPSVLAEYRQKFKYILVDEFQDTNWAQYELVKLLAEPENNLTVVADDDQSIYRFRGASTSNVIMFFRDFPEAKRVSLVRNYRSGQAILDAAYSFIQLNNPNRLESTVIASEVPRSGTERSNPEAKAMNSGIASVASRLRNDKGALGQGIDKKLVSQTGKLAQIAHLHCQTVGDEARVASETILELKKRDKESSWNDFAILARANSHLEIFADMLAVAQIPHQNLSASGLYATPLILNLLAFFRVIADYHESPAVFRLLNLPFLEIAAEDIIKLTHYAHRKRIPLFSLVKSPQQVGGLSEKTIIELNNLYSQLEKRASQAKKTKPTIILLEWMEEAGYFHWLNRLDGAAEIEQYRLLKSFYERLKSLEQEIPDARVRDMVETINLELEGGERGPLPADIEAGPEAVKLLTIHGAKGLEFKYTFLANLVDKRFPTIERKEPIVIPDELVKEILPAGDFHLQEERRLFYVAATRAKEGLFFTSAEDYGGASHKKLSRFLYELAEVYPTFKISRDTLKGDHKSWLAIPLPTLSEVASKGLVPLGRFNIGFGNFGTGTAKFSFTQLRAFESCPLQYKFAHILKVPIQGKHVFSYGESMHATLQDFFERWLEKAKAVQSDLFSNVIATPSSSVIARRPQADEAIPMYNATNSGLLRSPRQGGAPRNDMPLSLDELLAIYDKNWIDDWYESAEQKEEYYKKGKTALKKFYEDISQNPPQVKSLEQGFNFKAGEYTVMGKIDRIDIVDDGVELIDYKTGASRDRLDTENKEQLLMYQIAAEEVMGERVKQLTYYYLDDGQKVSFLGTTADKEKIKEKITATIDKIKNSNFDPTPSPFVCKFCDFRDICEFRAG